MARVNFYMRTTVLVTSLSLALASVALPFVVRAATTTPIISEIMYDLPGSDAGREWIEITNTSSQPVDVSSLKLFEASTNHALSLVLGSKILPPNGSAIIADDPVKFKIDWPNYLGALFNSTFTLSNANETLVLKDSSLATVDSVSYDHSQGAAGDGNSLQWNGSIFVPSKPTPGTYDPFSLVLTTTTPTPSPTPKATSTSVPKKLPTPPVSYKKAQTVEQVISTTNALTNEKAMQAPAVAVEPAAAGATLPDSASAKDSGLLHSPWLLGLIGIILIFGGAFVLL